MDQGLCALHYKRVLPLKQNYVNDWNEITFITCLLISVALFLYYKVYQTVHFWASLLLAAFFCL